MTYVSDAFCHDGAWNPGSDFKLFDTVNNQPVSLQDFDNAKGLLVVFMCNHCPYVQHILEEFVVAARDLQQKVLG